MTLPPNSEAQAQNAMMASSIKRSEELRESYEKSRQLRELVGRMLTGIRVLRGMLKNAGLGGVDVADEMIEDAEKEVGDGQ